MSFDDYRRTIEITSDPQVVEQWKEEARKAVTFRTKDEQNPVTFESLAAVEQHFRTHYLPSLIRPCLATELSGETARHLPDRGIIAAIRKARDRENRFPAQIAGSLRHGLNQAGLHVFKHKKRILYISTVRPQLFDQNQASVSSNLSSILCAIRSYPKISRKQLAEKILSKLAPAGPSDEASTEHQHAKTALATDLIWLAKAGHVIEFADGTLDLPLPPKPTESDKGSSRQPVHDTPKELEATSPELVVPGSDEFEENSNEEVRTTGPEVPENTTDHSAHETKPAVEALDVLPNTTVVAPVALSQPSGLELEKNDEADCAPAGSGSHLA
jgi:hypothetical protein